MGKGCGVRVGDMEGAKVLMGKGCGVRVVADVSVSDGLELLV